jgi:predicted Na+-dependent transporter
MLFHQMQLMVCAVLARRWAGQKAAEVEAEAPPQAAAPTGVMAAAR